MRYAQLTAAALLLAAAACDPAGPGSSPGNATMTARIAGAAFDANFAFARPSLACESLGYAGLIEIAGTQLDGTSIALAAKVTATGDYPLHHPDEVCAGAAGVTLPAGRSFATDWEGASGTLTVTELPGDRIRGSFTFRALDGPAGAAMNVTEGRFDVPLCQSYADEACLAMGL